MNPILDKAPQAVLLLFGVGVAASVVVAVGASVTGHPLDAGTAQLVNQLMSGCFGGLAGAGITGLAQRAQGKAHGPI